MRLFLTASLLLLALPLLGQVPERGLSLWLRADSGITQQAGVVERWADASGQGHDARARPDRDARWEPSARNGKPAVFFDGLRSGLVTPPFATFPDRRGTILVVLRMVGRSKTSGAGAGAVVSTYHGNGPTWEFCMLPTQLSFYDGISGSARPISSSSSGWNIIALQRNNDSTIRLYQRGRLSGTLDIDPNQPAVNALKIGFNGHGGGMDSIPEIFHGYIAEVLVYGRSLGDAELEAAHAYLSEKWNIPLLPPPLWQRPQFIAVMALLLVVVTVTVTRFFARRGFRRALARLEQERALEAERNRISKDMHDEIGSGLTQIALLSELMQVQERSREELIRDVASISASARRLVQNMGEIVWTLNPQFDSLENLLAFLREQARAYFEPFDIELQLHFPDALPPVRLSNEQRRNLFLVAKEAWNNAFKHAGAHRIVIALQVEPALLRFSVHDDGAGMPAAVRAGANGLRNMEKRMLEIGGEFGVQSGPRGTTVSFSLPFVPQAGSGLPQ
ncbi:histidine kinase [Flaviaesturariibacter amylovorans]|uniref:Histidine kinase domain-containing protein n=1 Tax=Flaviaesturariibacter amylovorans TaxID=1084520 RepID=A0ABP8G9B3_9BACT